MAKKLHIALRHCRYKNGGKHNRHILPAASLPPNSQREFDNANIQINF